MKIDAKTVTSGVLILSLLLLMTGCFGSFALTEKVYDFNDEISEQKWVKEVLFLAFVIVPVYGVATLVDGIVINSIEFWTGDNPLHDPLDP